MTDDPPLMAPRCLALVIADTISKDPSTGKTSILGTFSAAHPSKFPCTLQMSVFFVLVSCRGKFKVALRFVKASEDALEDEVQFIAEIELEADDPLQEIAQPITFRGQIPEPGVYFLQLTYADHPIMERRIVIQGAKQ